MMTSRELTAAYILHARDYRDTSQIIEVLSLEEGRFSVVVKGSRSARSRYQGRLQPFAPLLIATSGKSELKTATRIDFSGSAFRLQGDALLIGLYANELLYRLLGKFDPSPAIFEGYESLLSSLESSEEVTTRTRQFELMLLQELGYGIDFEFDVGRGTSVDADNCYRYVVHEGFYLARDDEQVKIPGRELMLISAGDLTAVDPQRLKHITRKSIAALLGGKPLKSRDLFMESRP